MTRSSSSARINIAASARKIDVNNRIPIRFYHRIAESVLKQADIFRDEGNIVDLYVMLLRFSSLVTETIPCHRDYRTSLQSSKILKKKLLDAVTELEEIKSDVQREIEKLSRNHVYQRNTPGYQHQSNLMEPSVEWPPAKQPNMNGSVLTKSSSFVPRDYAYQTQNLQPFSVTKCTEGKFRPITLSVHRPNEETLNRHSIFGPNGLRGQWQPPVIDKRVCYPSNIDFSPVEIPSKSSVHKPVENGIFIKKDEFKVDSQMPKLESAEPENKDCQVTQVEEPGSLISFEAIESPPRIEITRQPSPPPVLADVQDLIPTTPSITDADCRLDNSSSDGLVCAEAPLELHISTTLMDSFMRMAKCNTDKNLETCGVLAGSLKNRKFCVTTLIIPKQESTSDSCQTTNEEEIFEVQDKQSLFPLGWIHTHPTQSCFMSSIDVHTHYSYQIMLPEAIAIVMAPRDGSRNHGIFRLTSGGMTVIRNCPRRGFHAHDPPADGSPIYKHCTDVYINPELKFDVIDLR